MTLENTARTMSKTRVSALRLTLLVLPFLLFLLLPNFTSADRTKAKIYIDMLEAKGCFRRMNSTGVVGCQSSYNGDVGVIHYIRPKHAADLDFVISKGATPPYIAVMNPVDFTRLNVDKLIASHESGRVNGIVVIGSKEAVATAETEGFSGDAACPNRKFGLYSEEENCHEWNAPGSGLLIEQFPFPVFLVANSADLTHIENDCFKKYNDPGIDKNKPEVTYPLCGMELHSFMYGSVSSKRCLRRSTKIDISAGSYDQQCDPLGDQNVFGFLRDPQSPPPSASSVVIVSARLDTTSFFENVYPGADSPASGIVALLATAHTLKKVEAKIKAASKNVLFTLFNGESFDYLGSNRVVFDMTSSNSSKWPVSDASRSSFVPIEMEHLSHFVELSQFSAANSGAKGNAYLFADNVMSGEETEKMLNSMIDIGATIGDLEVAKVADVLQLPPASLQQFLKAVKKNKKLGELPGVVVAEHKENFANKFYNSFLDTSANIADKEKLTANLGHVATLTARSVLKLTTGQDDDKLEADSGIVEDLVECFIYDTNCTLFKSVLSSQDNVKSINDKKLFFSYYVGVLRSRNMYRQISSLILAKFTGDIDPTVSKANCTGELNIWMLLDGNASCVRAYVGTTEAASPAIDNLADNFLFSFDDEKAKDSAVWTESVWSPNTLTARIFLIPSMSRQITILLIGIIEFIVFMVLMSFVSKRSDILFNIDTATQEVLTEAAG